MKTKNYLIILSILGWAYTARAQVYYSKDFEKKGVTEYLGFGQMGPVSYWNTALPKPVRLVWVSESKFKFANSSIVYRTENGPTANTLWCIPSKGRKQLYKVIPSIYISRNFEKKGITEFLQFVGQKVYYFTNRSRAKIKLQKVGNDKNKVRFPGSKAVYKLTSFPMMKDCIHPNGKRQTFSWYDLNSLSKMIKANPSLRRLIEQ